MKTTIKLVNEASYQDVVLIQAASFLSIWIPNATIVNVSMNFTPENCREIIVIEEWVDGHGQQQTRTRTIEGFSRLRSVRVDPKDNAAVFIKLVSQ